MKTASYFTYSGVGRVSISRSLPRGMVIPVCRQLAPGPWFRSVDVAEYRVRYFEQLSSLSAKATWDELHALVGNVEPVLLCFERPPFSEENWCHRRMVAEWFANELSFDVSEVEQPKHGQAQGSLL